MYLTCANPHTDHDRGEPAENRIGDVVSEGDAGESDRCWKSMHHQAWDRTSHADKQAGDGVGDGEMRRGCFQNAIEPGRCQGKSDRAGDKHSTDAETVNRHAVKHAADAQ